MSISKDICKQACLSRMRFILLRTHDLHPDFGKGQNELDQDLIQDTGGGPARELPMS